MTPNELVEKLTNHPEIMAKIEALLSVVDSPIPELENANNAEEYFIAGLRNLGQNLMSDWANQRAKDASVKFGDSISSAKKNIKKKSNGTQRSDR